MEIEDETAANAAALARLRTYKASGLNVYMTSPADAFAVWSGEDGEAKWQASSTKRVFDLCQQVGLKVLLTDSWLLQISDITKDNPDKSFDEVYPDLVSTVKTRMAPYANHPALYGVLLLDEPRDAASAERFGKIYKAVKTAYPHVEVEYNLLPGMENEYYEAYIDAMGADRVMFDQYPLYTTHVYRQYIGDLQRIARLCKEKGVDMQVVTQTMRMISGTPRRELDEADLYWLNNMLAGFGVKGVYYFTYYTPTDNATETYEDGYSFIDDNGNTTHVYDGMQKIMAEMQLLAPVILEYDYNASAVYKGNEIDGCDHEHYNGITNDTKWGEIYNTTFDNDHLLLTELKNAEGRYMYMAQNVADPDCTCAGERTQTTTLQFGPDVTKITVFKDGAWQEVTLTDRNYTFTQAPGEAVYIVV